MTLVIGHKGAPTEAPENTVASFARAKELGADGVELDVRRAGSGDLVVWHDPVLADGRVLRELPWAQLKDAVDPLDAVLDAAAGLQLVNVEIKNWPTDPDFDPSLRIADAVADVLEARRAAEREHVVVSCFHPDTLHRARAVLDDLAPEVATGVLLWGVDDVNRVVAQAAQAGHAALHPHYSALTAELIDQAHQAGLSVNCWTCNDRDEIRRLAGLGIDGIITDQPAQALAALGR